MLLSGLGSEAKAEIICLMLLTRFMVEDIKVELPCSQISPLTSMLH